MPSAARAHPLPAGALPPPANLPMAPPGEKPLLFLDFEASSLTRGSWPVEIGFAWIESGRVEASSAIIAPRLSWSMDDWSEGAARYHGITLETVRSGRPAAEVAAETERFGDFTVVSDNPRWEQRWLDRLRAGRQPIEVKSLRSMAGSRLTSHQADALALYLLRAASPHRAGADAARMAAAWLAATQPTSRAAA